MTWVSVHPNIQMTYGSIKCMMYKQICSRSTQKSTPNDKLFHMWHELTVLNTTNAIFLIPLKYGHHILIIFNNRNRLFPTSIWFSPFQISTIHSFIHSVIPSFVHCDIFTVTIVKCFIISHSHFNLSNKYLKQTLQLHVAMGMGMRDFICDVQHQRFFHHVLPTKVWVNVCPFFFSEKYCLNANNSMLVIVWIDEGCEWNSFWLCNCRSIRNFYIRSKYVLRAY